MALLLAYQLLIATPLPRLTDDGRCRPAPGEIVVCRRDPKQDSQRYRLPLPREEAPAAARDMAMPTKDPSIADRPCGLFAGQRRCGKAEALRYGYGGGADPLSALVKLGTLLADPDADVAAPVALPKGFVPPPR